MKTIDLFGEVGFDFTSASVQRTIAGAGAIMVRVNSYGGDAFEGIAIYNMLKSHPAKVTTQVVGIAASAASIVALAGESIEMLDGSIFMMHNPWAFDVSGDREKLGKAVNAIEALTESYAAIYSKEMGIGKDEALAMMSAETWVHDVPKSQKKLSVKAFYRMPKLESLGEFATIAASIVAKSGHIVKKGVEMQEFYAKFGVADEKGMEVFIASLTESKKVLSEQVVALKADISALAATVDEYKSSAVQSEIKSIIDAAVAEGRLAPARVEWATSLADGSPARLRSLVEGLPVVVAKAEVKKLETVDLNSPEAKLLAAAQEWVSK